MYNVSPHPNKSRLPRHDVMNECCLRRMKGEDNDAIASFQQFLNDLMIYEPATLLEKPQIPPSINELAHIKSEKALYALRIMRKYVRPRHEVLKIRRVVNTAFQKDQIEGENVYIRHSKLTMELNQLKAEKAKLEAKLKSLKSTPDADDHRTALVGNVILRKMHQQLKVLQIYNRHLQMLLGNRVNMDNETTLVFSIIAHS